MTAHLTDTSTETGTVLEIGCECDHDGQGCTTAADVWVIIHDLCDDCTQRDDGCLSKYLCNACWSPFSVEVDKLIAQSHGDGTLLRCSGCDMPIRRRTDVIHRVKSIRGTKR